MTSGEIDLIEIVGKAGLMVQLVLALLLAFSIASWAIIFFKWYIIHRAMKESGHFTEIFWESRDLAVAFNEARDLEGSPLARLFSLGYMELKKLSKSGAGSKPVDADDNALHGSFTGMDNVKRTLRRGINLEMTRMTRWVPFLATTGNTTPFIGLFGTVWGIMNSFHAIGKTGSANLAAVAPGISEALVATAAGLAVAIPAVIAFNYFMQKIRNVESQLQSFSADFLNIIERDIMA